MTGAERWRKPSRLARDRTVGAGRGRGRDELGSRLGLDPPQRRVEGQRIARPALVAVGGYHRHVGESGEGLAQAADAFGAKAVIVAHEDLHACAGNRPVRSWRDYIL